jgi:inhibitor of cysteine peptidase
MKRPQYNVLLSIVFLCFLGAVVFLFGCTGGTEIGNPEFNYFTSDQELTAYLADQYAQSAQSTELWNLDKGCQLDSINIGIPEDEKGYSEQNIQDAGVAESDTVKTDGEYLYVAGENEVRVISALPPQSMQVKSRISVGGQVDSIYLHEKKLVILYTPSGGQGVLWLYSDNLKMIDVGMPYWNPVKVKTGILLADVSDPIDPSVIKDIQFEGSLLSSRVTGNNLHVISQFIPVLPQLNLWYDGTLSGKESTVENNRTALEPLSLDEYIPSYAEYDDAGTLIHEGRLIASRDFLRPKTPAGGTIVSVITVSLADMEKDLSAIGFVADIHHAYTTSQSIYLISNLYRGQTGENVQFDPEIYKTRIYQFDISDDSVSYGAEGLVKGHVLNRFSLGEYNGILRIATTTGSTQDSSVSNHVFCLEKQNEKLDIIGSLENLAPGERLHSARFIGNRGFLVTFAEADPFINLDLSDPRNPVSVGELNVPGNSTYLYPLGDDYLLTIGKNTISDSGLVVDQGLWLSIYDIRNFSAPRLLSGENIGDRGTNSEALFNHKAIMFLPERNLLALPVNLYDFQSSPENSIGYGENQFAGLYVYHLTNAYEFEYLGRIDMSLGKGDGWIRGIFLNDDVYSMSSDWVKTAGIQSIIPPFSELILSP